MQQSKIASINRACQEAQEWIDEVDSKLGLGDEQAAYHALRGVLFALRDRLIPEEAVHLGAQLPMLLRGVYYEAYSMSGKPEKIRNVDDFLALIARETSRASPSAAPEDALKAVSAVLAARIDGGQFAQVKDALPAEIQQRLAA